MSILLKGGLLIDGTGSTPISDGAVLVDGERVIKAGRTQDIAVPRGTTVIDVTGKTILPGLIDAHDHMSHTEFGTAEGSRVAAEPHDDEGRGQSAYGTLHAGITTIRDAGGGLDVGFKQAVEQGLIPDLGCRLGLSIISRTGGIGDPRMSNGVDLSGDLPGAPLAGGRWCRGVP